jgi:hypothetical protein
MTIRSDPPGALVYVDDQPIGETPVSTEFTYYGTRKLQLIKDGYETLTVKQTFATPWYEIPPLDLVSENFWPREVRDERLVNFQLQPQQLQPTDKLVERADQLRVGARQGYAVTLPQTAPRPVPTRPLPTVPPPAPPAGMPAPSLPPQPAASQGPLPYETLPPANPLLLPPPPPPQG